MGGATEEILLDLEQVPSLTHLHFSVLGNKNEDDAGSLFLREYKVRCCSLKFAIKTRFNLFEKFVSKMFENLQGTVLSAGIALACGFGFLLFGYDQGIFGGVLNVERFLATFGYPDTTIQSQIVATYDLGCFFGAIIGSFIGDMIGRRRTIMTGCLVLSVGGTLQASSFSIPQMIIGRFVAGLGNGMNSTTIPVWQSETSSAHRRGQLVILELSINILGSVVAQWINFAFTYVTDSDAAWRFPLAFQCFFAFFTFSLILCLPESPRWLVYKGRIDEAQTILARLASLPRDSPEVLEITNDIVVHVQHELELVNDYGFFDIFRNGRMQNFRRITLGAGTQFMQQFGGINVVNYYLPVLLSRYFSMTNRMALIISGCFTINLFVCSVIPVIYIEKFGRKKIMFWGSIGQGICYSLVTIGVALGGKIWSSVAIAFIFGYASVFGLSFIAIPWLYPAEVNSQRFRTQGSAIATGTNWISAYVVVLVTPIGVENIGWKYYLIYAITNFAFVPFIYYFYVETSGLTLEQIDELFEQKFFKGDPKSPVSEDSPVFEDSLSRNDQTEKTGQNRVGSV